jgi:hypothetical protein
MSTRFIVGTASVARAGTKANPDGIGTLGRAMTLATCTRIPTRDMEGHHFPITVIGIGGESGATGSGIKRLISGQVACLD